MNTSENGKAPVERAVHFLVHAPVGFALMAVQAVPNLVSQLVSKGCAQFGGAETKMRQARMIGQVAVNYGGRQIRREVDTRLSDARRRAGGLAGHLPGFQPTSGTDEDALEDDLLAGPRARPAPSASTRPAAARKRAPASPSPRTNPSGRAPAPNKRSAARSPASDAPPAGADLPIPEYDGLSASQVVQRLTGLTAAELEAVRTYEAAGRGRKTVLAAVERLRR